MNKNKNIYIIIIVIVLVILLAIKLFNIYKTNLSFIFASYDGFEIDGDTIVKYNIEGGNVVVPRMVNGVVITKIGDYAFNDLNIDNITIPDTITTIGDYAFANNNLTILNLPDSVTSLGEGAFMHNALVEIKMKPDIEIGNACFNDNMLNEEEAFFYKDSNREELISYGGKIRGNVDISNNKLTTIGEKAFLETYIVSISIPDSVTLIKEQAFKGNHLVEMYLSSNIEAIEVDAFVDNAYLTEIVINKESNSILNYPWGADNSNLYWLKK